MFETAELGQKVSKEEYRRRVPTLRQALVETQVALRDAPFPVIVLFAGVDAAGKGETVNLLNEWMDPRWIVTHAFSRPTQEEAERPEFWRFWRALPPRGRIGLYLKAWYSRPLLLRAFDEISARELDDHLDHLVSFERMLAQDGALILKFWLHLGRDQQEKRLKALAADPHQAWRVTDRDWEHWGMYDQFAGAAEQIIRRTSTGAAPWTIVEGYDARYRSLKVTTDLLTGVQRHLASRTGTTPAATDDMAEPASADPPSATPEDLTTLPPPVTILSRLDMTQTVPGNRYPAQLRKLQARLNSAHRLARERDLSTILLFEGWDAAGKGGAIRRVVPALDARAYQVIPIAAPTDEERAHHYLWRFWRHLPRAGRFTIFDRSWYGRVLVERVEGFANESEWRRAYAEINEFEHQLSDHGIHVIKMWMHISHEEQERRFREREATPHKRWKLSDEDWRNRERWEHYEIAVNDMVEQTSTRTSPWHLVEGDDKRFARLKVLRTICERLEQALETGEKS